jgi:hypothetical protein
MPEPNGDMDGARVDTRAPLRPWIRSLTCPRYGRPSAFTHKQDKRSWTEDAYLFSSRRACRG